MKKRVEKTFLEKKLVHIVSRKCGGPGSFPKQRLHHKYA